MTPPKGSVPIQFASQTFHLLPDRAIWWPTRSTVIIADAHLGKSASFRRAGLPVPEGSTVKDLSRLDSLIQQTSATRLVVLGDFLHSRAGRQPEVLNAIADWRRANSIPILLIRGNHDRSAGYVPGDWNIDETEEPHIEDGIAFAHHSDCRGEPPTLCGHVHPVVALEDYDRSIVTTPCFVVDPDCLMLPSFGTFTGGHKIHPQPRRTIYIVAPGRVLRVPS